MATLATVQHSESRTFRTLVRAMGQTGGASLASGLLSLTATKLIAVVLGPAHMAIFATLQQIRAVGVNAATLTGGTALVQGASALDGRERRELLRTVLCLMTGALTTVTAVLWFAPGWVARQAGLPESAAPLAAGVTLAVVFGTAHVFSTSMLNASGAIGPLSRVQLAAPAAMAILAYPAAQAIRRGHSETWVALLAVSAAAGMGAAGWALHHDHEKMRSWLAGPGSWWNWVLARRFLGICGSMLASGVVSSWVLLGVRARILRTEGLATGGQFDAAWAISMHQAGLVLASLQTYYLPALARTASPAARTLQIRRVLGLAAAAAAVVIALLALTKTLALTTLYSAEFTGASRYLRWTLAGDYLKITSWILSIPLVAAADMRAFLVTDLAAWASFAVAAGALPHWFSTAESAAIAFVIMYAVHLVCCGAALWKRRELPADGRTLTLWFAGLALVVGASAASWSTS